MGRWGCHNFKTVNKRDGNLQEVIINHDNNQQMNWLDCGIDLNKVKVIARSTIWNGCCFVVVVLNSFLPVLRILRGFQAYNLVTRMTRLVRFNSLLDLSH